MGVGGYVEHRVPSSPADAEPFEDFTQQLDRRQSMTQHFAPSDGLGYFTAS